MSAQVFPVAKPPPESTRETVPGLSSADFLGMLLGLLLCLTVSLVFARGRIFWEDELLGWMLLRDPSWHHMVAAWRAGADGGGFGFYVTARGWFRVFGPSEISLRMYSATCLGLAFAVVWVAARRYYRAGVVAFALFNTWFFSPPIVIHMAEGRFYGLLTLGAALVVWFTLGPARAELGSVRPAQQTPLWLYPLAFLCHGLLTTSHLLGAVYSFFLLAALVLADCISGRVRPALYASAAAAWLLLIPEREALLASAHVGKPHFWTVPPNLYNFLGAYTAFSGEIAAVMAALGIGLFLTLRRSPSGRLLPLRAAFGARYPVWIVTLAFLSIPLAYVIEGHFGPSLFVNRYLLPVCLAQIFLTAEGVTLIDWCRVVPAQMRSARWARPVAVCLFAAAMLAWIFGHTQLFVIPPKNYTEALTALLPKGIPVVCEDAWSFSELIAREHDSGVHYTYLLDWPESVSADASLLQVTQYHLMENWQKVGYFSGSIVDRDAFLAKNSRFLVLRVEPEPRLPGPLGYGNPLADRFAQTPGYEVKPYAVLHRERMTDIAWMVCRGGCGNAAATGH